MFQVKNLGGKGRDLTLVVVHFRAARSYTCLVALSGTSVEKSGGAFGTTVISVDGLRPPAVIVTVEIVVPVNSSINWD